MSKQISDEIVKNLISVIRFVVLFVVLIIWTIIGFAFWIPLLTRTTAMFSLGVLYTMVSANPREYTSRLRAPLDFATSFYVEGYQRIFITLYPPSIKSLDDLVKQPILSLTNINFNWKRFIAELLWTTLFWTLVMLGPTLFRNLVRVLD